MAATDSRRKHAALNEALYREILENCADAVVVVDAQQKILSVNNSAATMFGHPREFIAGQALDLDEVEQAKWFEVRLKNEEANQQLEAASQQLQSLQIPLRS